ncbi:hypothetical protein M011DRAFT_420013, partial [Sporormia fimetaria CBS 119925]
MGLKRSRTTSASSLEDPSTSSARESSVDVKIVHIDADTAAVSKSAVMQCSLPPHKPLWFSTYEEYDVHYSKTHTNRCQECHKNFPDEHFLHLHIAENHDPISAAKRDRGEKTYACLVSTCDRLCSTPQKRRLHCIDKHLFPRNYDFFVINDGIDRRGSMLRPPQRRRSSTVSSMSGMDGGSADGHRKRSSTLKSALTGDMREENGQDGDAAKDVVRVTEDEEMNEEREEKEEMNIRRTPIKLHGRGGFGRPRGGRGRGSGRGGSTHGSGATEPTPVGGVKKNDAADPVEGLASRMSALQFVPHSVRVSRGRGR